MGRRRNLDQAQALMPLLRAIAAEIRERRLAVHRLEAARRELEAAARRTPEGLERALAELDFELASQEHRIAACLRELAALGLRVPTLDPLVIHIPGTSEGRPVTFCWEEAVHAFDGGSGRTSPERAA